VNGSPAKREAMVDGALEISENPFGCCPVGNSWRVHELT